MMTDPIRAELLTIEDELRDLPDEGGLPEVRPAFAVEDEKTATWLVGKLAERRATIARIKEQAAAMVRDAERDIEYLEWRFGPELEMWAAANLEGKKKSVKLLTGTVGFRSQKGKLVVVDEAACLEWARDNCPVAYVVEPRLVKTPIDDLFQKTGEIPPGCEYVEGGEKFYVK
jgi:hypothetical protein